MESDVVKCDNFRVTPISKVFCLSFGMPLTTAFREQLFSLGRRAIFPRSLGSHMASHARALLIARRCFSRLTPTPATFSTNTLLAKLLREPESGIKITLDSDDTSSPHLGDTSSWEPLLTALASSSPRKAHIVLEWKLEKLLKEGIRDQDCYSKIISLSGKLGNVSFSFGVFTALESRGIRPNTSIFNALVSNCLSAGDFVTGMSLFEIMERTEDSRPDLTTYNAFISMYSKLGDHRGMTGWYLAAKKSGFSPNVQTYDSLIAGFIKAGRLDDADRYYQEMILLNIKPNIAILESMLEGICRRRDVIRVKEFLKIIIDGGWELNGAMTNNLLRLYTEMGLVEEMEELLGSLEQCIDFGVVSRVHHGIIKSYALMGRLDDMENSIGRMLKGGRSFAQPEDVEAIICAYFRQKAHGRLDLFLDQIRVSHKLARSTYDLLVAGYRKYELYERLDSIIDDMKRAGFA